MTPRLLSLPPHIEYGRSAEGSEYANIQRIWIEDGSFVCGPVILAGDDPELLALCKIIVTARNRISVIIDERDVGT